MCGGPPQCVSCPFYQQWSNNWMDEWKDLEGCIFHCLLPNLPIGPWAVEENKTGNSGVGLFSYLGFKTRGSSTDIVAAVLVWLSFLLLISNGVFHQEIGDASRRAQALRCDQLNDQLTQLHIEQRALKEENSQLKRLALSRNFQPADDELMHLPVVKSDSMAKNGLKRVEPMKVAADERLKGQLYSKDHEVSRRRMDTLLWETFFYLDKQLEDVKPDKIKGVQKHIKNQMITLLTQSSNLGTKVDQASEWHKRALEKLTRRIQNTLHKLQHPSDCSKAKILLCDLNKGCGFGCQLHHVTYCLMVAAASQRTMILEKDGTEWRYSRNGWNSVFLPLTNCSFEKETANGAVEAWSGLNQAARVVRLPIVDDVLLTHHSNPPVFFVAQFLWYLMQDTDQMKKVVEEAEKKIPFDKATFTFLMHRGV
uniref:GT23 domain-containing protein n=1 Tax=Ditylenchus dipsaci TaxID=166011 RepID=A0A915ENW1_9BILA